MAEWLCQGLQILLHWFDSNRGLHCLPRLKVRIAPFQGVDMGSTPVGDTNHQGKLDSSVCRKFRTTHFVSKVTLT